MLHFEKCQQIWGGSPADEQLDGWVESEDLLEPQSELSAVSPSTQPEEEPSGASAQLPAEGEETSTSSILAREDTEELLARENET